MQLMRACPRSRVPCFTPCRPADTFASQAALACSLLWRQRAALLHDLQAGRACASWEVAELAPPGVALPPPAALASVDSLLSRLRAAAGEDAWRRNAEAVAQAFEAADGPAGLLCRLFPSLSLIMCVATGAQQPHGCLAGAPQRPCLPGPIAFRG